MIEQIKAFFGVKASDIKKRIANKQELLESQVYGIVHSKSVKQKEIAYYRGRKVDLESRIKQQSRFLEEGSTAFYITYIQPVIERHLKRIRQYHSKINLIIDSTSLANNCMGIMLSVYDGKQAIPLIWDVYQGRKGHLLASYAVALMERADALLKPFEFEHIFLFGDGEYSSSEFIQALVQHHWDFLFRIAINDTITFDTSDACSLKHLEPDVYAEHVLFNSVKSHRFNVIKIHDKKHKEPICLLSNCLDGFEMAHEYPKRFAIERLFKNLKSNGFSIHKSKLSLPNKVCNLLSMVVIAFKFVLSFEQLMIQQAHNGLLFRKDRADLSLFVACYQFLFFTLNADKQLVT